MIQLKIAARSFSLAILFVLAAIPAMAQKGGQRFAEPYREPPKEFYQQESSGFVVYGESYQGIVAPPAFSPTLIISQREFAATSESIVFAMAEQRDDDETLAEHLTIGGQDVYHSIVNGDEWFADGWNRQRKDACVTALLHDVLVGAFKYEKSTLRQEACGAL